jgi:hypothetical protein
MARHPLLERGSCLQAANCRCRYGACLRGRSVLSPGRFKRYQSPNFADRRIRVLAPGRARRSAAFQVITKPYEHDSIKSLSRPAANLRR